MKQWLPGFLLVALLVGFSSCQRQAEPPREGSVTPHRPDTHAVRIVWAQWAPADYLAALANEFAAQSGIPIAVEQIPWDRFQQTVFQALDSREPTYDIVIGDSQWLGRGVERGHYADLTDWLKTELGLERFLPAALAGYSEYPRGSGRYWAVPCQADAVGWAYRKDLFQDPKERAAFRARYHRDLAVPRTWDEVYDLAEFFYRPERGLWGISLLIGDRYDTATMGFQNVLWSFGGSFGDERTFQVEGYINGPNAVRALEFFVRLARFAPPQEKERSLEDTLRDFREGRTAMAMNYFALFPTLVDRKTNPTYWNKIGFFAGPRGPRGRYVSLGGQGMSLCAVSPRRGSAKRFMAWFAREAIQQKWVRLGGFTCNRKVLASRAFLDRAPYHRAFAESLTLLRDFWATSEFDDLLAVTQRHLARALRDEVSAREALNAIAREHTEVFRRAGRVP